MFLRSLGVVKEEEENHPSSPHPLQPFQSFQPPPPSTSFTKSYNFSTFTPAFPVPLPASTYLHIEVEYVLGVNELDSLTDLLDKHSTRSLR
ncbi:hypothetical protein E2C01_038390 [Portunus trituberculatus]|uniref:Uncharacterized protein n=1 Tax=Portunus trituberculatus TaxID=210409 RepID=A0A5B7FC37_PORTR|nr:hypothetical protein [Portunus trituberculatus]